MCKPKTNKAEVHTATANKGRSIARVLHNKTQEAVSEETHYSIGLISYFENHLRDCPELEAYYEEKFSLSKVEEVLSPWLQKSDGQYTS